MTNFSLLGLGRHVARSENLRGRTTPPASPLPTYVSTVSFRGPQKQESKNSQSFLKNKIFFFYFIKFNPRHKHAKWPPSDLTPWTLTLVTILGI